MFERVAGELRATLGVDSAAICARAGDEACGAKARSGRASRRGAETHTSTQVIAGVEGAGGSGGHGRASRSTTPSEARVWRSRGRPGPTAPGTPAEPQATSSIANSGCAAGVEGAGGSGGHGRASRSTTPSEARVWRSRGRPGPTAPGTPAAHKHHRTTGRDQQELLAREAVDFMHDEAAHGAHPCDGCDAEDA